MQIKPNKTILSLFTMASIVGCQSEPKTHPHMSTEMPSQEQMNIPAGYASVKIDPQRIQLFGIHTEKIEQRNLAKAIRAVGIVSADERKIVNIQTKFSGWIVDLYVNFTNQTVRKGDPLYSIYSPSLLATQEEYLIAKKGSQNQMKGTFGEEYSQTNIKLFESAKQRLELWDIPQEEIERLDREGTSKRTLTVNSPIDGIVLEKRAFKGMNVEPGMNTLVVADLSTVWILVDIFEQDISLIQVGQKASFTLNAFPGQIFEGKVDFINYVLDSATRTTKVRLDFNNPDFLLKPGMYGTVELSVFLGSKLAVPEEAIIDTGERKIVFIEKEPGFYVPREIQIGSKADGYYQVLGGLQDGEAVVTSAQFLIDSESRIQATGSGMHGGMQMDSKK